MRQPPLQPVLAVLALLGLGLGAAWLLRGGSGPEAPTQAPPSPDPGVPASAWELPESGPVECTGWPQPSAPPPFLDRPEQGRLDSQLQLLGLEGDCAPRDAGLGITGFDCSYAGRGLHVEGQLLYREEGAGRVHVGREGPWRAWISTHPTWGGYLDVVELSCAVRLRELLARGGQMALGPMAATLRERGWATTCEASDPQGRAVCALSRGDFEGELVFLARPEDAQPAPEARTEEQGQARWVGPEGIVTLSLGRASTTAMVLETVFPELSEGAADADEPPPVDEAPSEEAP